MDGSFLKGIGWGLHLGCLVGFFEEQKRDFYGKKSSVGQDLWALRKCLAKVV